MLTAKPVVVREPAILITINRLYRSDMSPLELYEATRGTWVVGPRRDKAELALAVYQGVVREVYRIRAWHPAGTLEYQTRSDLRPEDLGRRWEFEGEVAVDVRDRYIERLGRQGRAEPDPLRQRLGRPRLVNVARNVPHRNQQNLLR